MRYLSPLSPWQASAQRSLMGTNCFWQPMKNRSKQRLAKMSAGGAYWTQKAVFCSSLGSSWFAQLVNRFLLRYTLGRLGR